MGILDYLKTAGDIAVNARNVELQGALLEIKREVLVLQERDLEQRARIAELEREREVRQSISYEKPSYYVTNNKTAVKDGPFCQRCYDADKKFIRTHDSRLATGVRRDCPECETKIWVERFPEPPQQPREDSWLRSRRGY
jgi:hypothetical protein